MRLAETAAALLGGKLSGAVLLQGGGLSEVVRITLEDGREAVAKNGSDPEREAAMLRAIAATGAPAPEVLAVSPEALAMTPLAQSGVLSGPAWGALGEALRPLHAAEGAAYGWEGDYAFGAVPILNAWSENWPAFWAGRRLLSEAARLPGPIRARLETLAARLPEMLPSRPAPSLLHGDLWVGNVLVDGARISGLIDPACYHGHAEVDLAMLSLFGAPSAAFWEAYGGPEPGWPTRRAVYQLWPAIVHLRLFGAGYRGMVEGLLDQAGV